MKRFRLPFALLAIAATLLLLAACAGPAAPAAQEGAASTEAAPAEAAPAEAAAPETTGNLPPDAIPYPDPPELDLGGAAVSRLPIDQLVTYKALPEYHEPEWVT